VGGCALGVRSELLADVPDVRGAVKAEIAQLHGKLAHFATKTETAELGSKLRTETAQRGYEFRPEIVGLRPRF
jgi:hypothetical protein